MSLLAAQKLRKVASERKKKHPMIRAVFNKLLHPTKYLMVYSPPNADNPYQTLFYSGFNRTIVAPAAAEKFLRYQILGISKLLHVHWDEDFLRKKDPQQARNVRNSLIEFKQKNGKVIWTVHNQMPHEIDSAEEREHFLSNRAFMCEMADAIHVHSEYAKQYLLNTFAVQEEKIAVIPHPSYVEWYCPENFQRTFREKKVFLLFGNIRKYKGFDLIIEAFSKVQLTSCIEHFHIAGYGADAVDYEVVNGIEIKRSGGYVDDDIVPGLFSSADFAIFGFSSILTSGSLMLALTFGLPPIAPAHPSIRELLPLELHDLLYEPDNSADFARVIDYANSLSAEEYLKKSELCTQLALKYSPSKISSMLEKTILKLVSN